METSLVIRDSNVFATSKFIFLMFMGPCIVIIFWYIIPTRCTSHRVYLNLTTALYVLGITIAHLQEHKTTASVTGCCRCSCFVLLKMGDSDARNMQSNYQIK